MKQLAVFDLDGTLLNTISDLGAAVNHALLRNGYPTHSLKAYNYMVGHGARKLIENALGDADNADVDTLLTLFRQYYTLHCVDSTVAYDGIPELLRTLTNQGVKIAVATNKYQEAAEKVITTLFPDIPFVGVYGQIPERNIKPDPSVVFSILNDCPTPKADVVFIGDSAVDIETARRACVESIGVTWGFRPVSELRRAYADHVVSQPSEILKIIQEHK